MGLLLLNNCSTTLTQALNDYDGQIHVPEAFFQKYVPYIEDWQDYSWDVNDELFLTLYDPENPAVNEIIRVNGAYFHDNCALYIERAQEGTEAREWPAGTPLAAFLTAGVLSKASSMLFKQGYRGLEYANAFQHGNVDSAVLNLSAGDPENTSNFRRFEPSDPEYKESLSSGIFATDNVDGDHYMSLYDSILSLTELNEIYGYSQTRYIVRNNNYIFHCGSPKRGLFENSVNVGALTVADGASAAAFGLRSFANPRSFNYYGNNVGAFAAGVRALAVHDQASAIGNQVVAAGLRSTAVGTLTAAIGERSTAIGSGVIAHVDDEFAFSGLSVMTAPAEDLASDGFGGANKNSFEMLLPSRFCDIGTPVPWVADSALRNGDVVAAGAGYQAVAIFKAFDPRESDNTINSSEAEPDWENLGSQDADKPYFVRHESGVGLQVRWVLPAHVMFFVTEVGFISHKMGAGVTSAGKISLGDRSLDAPNLVLNEVALTGAPAERRLHRIPVENPIGLIEPVVTLREIAAGGSYAGHFYLRGIAVRTQG